MNVKGSPLIEGLFCGVADESRRDEIGLSEPECDHVRLAKPLIGDTGDAIGAKLADVGTNWVHARQLAQWAGRGTLREPPTGTDPGKSLHPAAGPPISPAIPHARVGSWGELPCPRPVPERVTPRVWPTGKGDSLPWHCQSSACVSFSRQAPISGIARSDGIRRWRRTSTRSEER